MTETRLAPVGRTERIEVLDVLRGFAVIGVLYVNMHNFGSDAVTGTSHSAAAFFMEAVFARKFFSLFSLLFGVGFAVLLRRADTRGVSFVRVYWRRLAVLFVLGWVHALVYPGDIVRLYAVLGFALLLVRRWPVRRLVTVAVLILALDWTSWYLFRSGIVEIDLFSSTTVEDVVTPAAAADPEPVATRAEARAAARLEAYRQGSVLDVVAANLVWHERWTRIVVAYGPPALALFLLGLAIVRAGIVDDLERWRARLRPFMWTMLVLGAPGALITAYVNTWPVEDLSGAVRTLGSLLHRVSYPALALAYASFIVLRFGNARWRRLLRPLAAVGRMPLTAYIGQSVVYTSIYYGYGLGLFERLGPAHILPLAAIIFGAEVAVCTWWMRRFRFGPVEWLWRSATYLRWQPMS